MRSNLPHILAQVPRVDLFHYDSDKTYSGRAFAVELVRKKLAEDGLIVMDDLSNNSWFYEEAERGPDPYAVFDDPARFGVLGEI